MFNHLHIYISNYLQSNILFFFFSTFFFGKHMFPKMLFLVSTHEIIYIYTSKSYIYSLVFIGLLFFFLLLFLENTTKTHKRYAGLRGAIAVGLVVGIPTSLRYMMTSTTVTIVLLTVFIMGGTTAPFLKMCGQYYCYQITLS